MKIIIVGDSGVGKSSILTRYTRNEFTHSTKSTIGVELSTSLVNLDNKRIKVSIWDTGQERFRAATNLYYRNTLGALVVFDITNYATFQNVTRWLDEIKEYVNGNVIVSLVGNKCDLKHLRAVSISDAKALAEKHNLSYIETSALDSINIKASFENVISDIYNKIYKVSEEMRRELDEQHNEVNNTNKSSVVNLNINPNKEPVKCCNLN